MTIVVNDGDPAAVVDFEIDESAVSGLSEARLEQQISEVIDSTNNALASSKANDPEVDTFEAIKQAARGLTGEAGDKCLYILDSGLSTEGELNVLSENLHRLIDVQPIVDKLQKDKEEQPTKSTTVSAHTRKKRSSNLDGVLPENISVEVVEHGIPEGERVCDACGTVMERIGKETVRTLVLRPATATIREDVYYTYACPECKTDAAETPVRETGRVPSVIPGSFASPEAIAHIMVQKFVMASPLYRQEQELNRSGIQLSRQTMSNWILRASDDWLMPVYEEMHRRLVREDVLHADETTLQVLKEPGKSAQSKSYMWLYRAGAHTSYPMVLYEYRPDRKAGNAERFLKGFSGWLHADGYPGYHSLPEHIRVVGCWVHLRRKFDEAVKSLPQKDQPGSAALQGQAYCSKLFFIEQEMRDLPPKERYEQRLQRSKPVMDALLAWASTNRAAPKSALGKALYYLEEQWPYLIRALEDGRLELSNNLAERSIKPFVIGRKNFLFANTPRGAQSSAVIFSMIETAKANGLDPYRYLVYILTKAPVLAAAHEPDWAVGLLPENVSKACLALQN